MVFTKLSKAWISQFPEFGHVVQHTIIPSCFIGPSAPHVDLRDAQFQTEFEKNKIFKTYFLENYILFP